MRPKHWLYTVPLRLRSLLRRNLVENELDEELRDHLERKTEEYVAKGMAPEEAQRRARLDLGGVEKVKEECRDARRVNWIQDSVQDLRYGLRTLRKSPGFTAVAILTVALGIGANTAIFSVVNGVLLNPLPYPNSDRLVALAEKLPQFAEFPISYPDFLDWVRMNHTFQALAAYRPSDFNLTGSGEAKRVKAMQVSASFFPLLGVKPVIGRDFSPDEDKRGAAPVAMLSAGFWKTEFGAPDRTLGETITLDGAAYTVIGVVPADFYFCCDSTGFQLGDVYIPVGALSDGALYDRNNHYTNAVGRLERGVTLEQARADMDSIGHNLAATYPDSTKDVGIALAPLKERMVRDVKAMLQVLLAAVGFVLLIACANVANLLLARSTGRVREFAIRTALGASHGRVIRQLLSEGILLALIGGMLGLLIALWGTKAGLAGLPEALPRANDVRADPRVLSFTLFASVLAGVLFGLAPAMQSRNRALRETLQEGGRGSRGTPHRVQGAFVVVEMALAVVLLTGAGLMIRSLSRLWRVDPGFDPHNVLTFGVSLPPSTATATPDQIRATLRQLTDTAAAVPGVKAVSLIDGAQPMIHGNMLAIWIEGRPKPQAVTEMPLTLSYIVSTDYLKVMGIPLLRGRFLMERDNSHSQFVGVIDENFAREYFPNQDPIGRRIRMGFKDLPIEIVGEIGHVKQWGLDENADTVNVQLYTLAEQMPEEWMVLIGKSPSLIVRTQTPSYTSADAIRRAIARMSGEQVAYDFESMEGIISGSLAARRFTMILLAIFAALAVLLASIGIYGVISHLVGQRTQEIVIRLALGAQRGEVLQMVLSRGAKTALVGIAVGIGAAFGLTRLMANLLFGITAHDPLTFAGVATILLLVAVAACYIPARRATRVDPMVSLRYE